MTSSLKVRLDKVREYMWAEGLAALLTTSVSDCRYLTDFTGEAAAVCVTENEVVLFTDPRFSVQAKEQAPDTRIVVFTHKAKDEIVSVLQEMLGATHDAIHKETSHYANAFVAKAPKSKEVTSIVGLNSEHLTVQDWGELQPMLVEAGLEWRFTPELLKKCRQIKYGDEVEHMRASAALAIQAFEYLESQNIVGRSEREVALDLEMYLRGKGSEGVAFSFIVAAGERSAMPHADPSAALIKPGQLVVFDLGSVVNGYASDITRTYATGDLDDELVSAYEAVRGAQAAALTAARAGIGASDLDAVARDYLESLGLAEYFVHSLGHGVGLEIHEWPNVSKNSQMKLTEGMVITIEPGVYLPGRGGIRIEDTVLIKDREAEVLTSWPRELKVLV